MAKRQKKTKQKKKLNHFAVQKKLTQPNWILYICDWIIYILKLTQPNWIIYILYIYIIYITELLCSTEKINTTL